MDFYANEGKAVTIQANGKTYARHAITTHFVQVGENYIDLLERYVIPVYQPGDILSASEKVIALCQGRVVTEEQVKPGFWAKLLSRFVHQTAAGPGMGLPVKMQFAINFCGLGNLLLVGFAQPPHRGLLLLPGILRLRQAADGLGCQVQAVGLCVVGQGEGGHRLVELFHQLQHGRLLGGGLVLLLGQPGQGVHHGEGAGLALLQLCPCILIASPDSHRDTAARSTPMVWANSLLVMPRFSRYSLIFMLSPLLSNS